MRTVGSFIPAVPMNVIELTGHLREVGRAEQAGHQADAVEHDARGPAAVDDVLERRLAALAAGP